MDEQQEHDDNLQQLMDAHEREERALQALMNVAAKGLKEEAELLAYESGLGHIWKQTIKERIAA